MKDEVEDIGRGREERKKGRWEAYEGLFVGRWLRLGWELGVDVNSEGRGGHLSRWCVWRGEGRPNSSQRSHISSVIWRRRVGVPDDQTSRES